MTKYFITGLQGSGKTTAGKELKKQGYTVFDIDHDGLGKLREIATGDLYGFSDILQKSPNGLVDRARYRYEIQTDKLKEALGSDKVVFVTGVSRNSTEFHKFFDKVFVLVIDPKTAERRLLKHEFATHHHPDELKRILANFDANQQELAEAGENVVQIDGRSSLAEIVAAIAAQI